MWVNLYKAYDALSPMKTFSRGPESGRDENLPPPGAAKEGGRAVRATYKRRRRCTVGTHPSRPKLLYVSELTTTHVEGLRERESDALLAMLFEHLRWPELQCRFYWEKNSIAMWDNRCTAHYAVRDYTESREMHRVTVLGKVLR